MSLVFSGIVPHPVNLLPLAGEENNNKLKITKSAIDNLADYLYAAKPETLIIITPHLPARPETFIINLAPKYSASFDQYGDKETRLEFPPDTELIALITERVRSENKNLLLVNKQELDHGSIIPLYLLAKHLPDIRIIPISSAELTFPECYEFGQLIQKEVIKSNCRTAVISSCNLAHNLTKDAPAAYSQAGAEFDSLVTALLQENNISGLKAINPDLAEKARECGFRAILINLGILDDIDFQAEQLAYEFHSGVGHLTEYFALR